MTDRILNETLNDFYDKYHYRISNIHFKLLEYSSENYINVYDNTNSSIELYNFILENTNIFNKMYENNTHHNTSYYETENNSKIFDSEITDDATKKSKSIKKEKIIDKIE